MITAEVEFHPENGRAPYVVVIKRGEMRLWMAYETEEKALERRPILESEWNRLDGMVELEPGMTLLFDSKDGR